MFGAIIGDICGSIYEFHNCKTENPDKINLMGKNCFFTDDSVLTIAVADGLLHGHQDHQGCHDFTEFLQKWGRRYPDAGYGARFSRWLGSSKPVPYNSWGNGSAMRVSPAGMMPTLEECLSEAKRTTVCTHNHPEGINGAQATAAAVWLAWHNASKAEIKEYIESSFHYDLSLTVDEIRPDYTFTERCQDTVPQAFSVFMESRDFAHAIRLAISIGGDSDTIACIVGGIAEAFYKDIPQPLAETAWHKLPEDMRAVMREFYGKFPENACHCGYLKVMV